MHIYLICQQSQQQYAVPASGFWRYYLIHGLTEAGHTVTEPLDADWAYGLQVLPPALRRSWSDKIWESTLQEIQALTSKGNAPDLILSYLFPNQTDASAVSEICRLGIPFVNFFCDNVREFERVPDSFKNFTLHWVPEFKALSMYRKAGLPFIFLPMPMWVAPEFRIPSDVEIPIVNFTGSRDRLRTPLLNTLAERITDLEVRGAGWLPEQKSRQKSAGISFSRMDRLQLNLDFILEQGFIAWYRKRKSYPDQPEMNTALSACVRSRPDPNAYISLTRESEITLGINRYPSWNFPDTSPDTYSRLRDLEAPMLGACYLTENTAGLDKLFDLEKEILVWSDMDELVHQIQLLRKNPALRKSLRKAGQQKALREHSIGNSIAQIVRHLQI